MDKETRIDLVGNSLPIKNKANTAIHFIEPVRYEVTVIAHNCTKFVGEPDPALTYTVENTNPNGEPGFIGSIARIPGESAGNYDIIQGSLELVDNGGFLADESYLTFVKGRQLAIISYERMMNNGRFYSY